MYSKCCVVNCNSRRQDVTFYSFPKDEKRLEMWLQCINCDILRSLNVKELRKHYVCEKHFEKRFLALTNVRPRLRVNAYPTLFSESEIRSGILQFAIRTNTDHIQRISCEHNYASKRRQHEDHTYGRTEKRIKFGLETDTSGTSVDLPNIHYMFHDNSSTANNELIVEDMVINRTIPSSGPKWLIRKNQLHLKNKVLSPSCKTLYKEFLKSQRQLVYRKRAQRALKFSKERFFEKITERLNPIAKKIMWMQIQQCTKKAKGRRFSEEEKLIALSILKQSPKCYRFLQKIFILPSKCTLNKMISSLNVEAGINEQVFKAVKKEVSTWNEKKKFCTILFDEVSLEPALNYEKKRDCINGFVELTNKTNDFADHALVFMLIGAIFKWQQPLAYYFCKGATSGVHLKTIIKQIISAVCDTGLLPVALICDQGTSFQSALKSLQDDTRKEHITRGKEIEDVIVSNGHTLHIIYDPPHLIKGLRNNFLTKDIKFQDKLCKWNDIIEVYKTDCNHAQTRLMHKLNDEHVIPEKIKKMKVKNCVRVFSKTVAATLSYTAQFSQYSDGTKVSPTLRNTAEAVSFFDDVFDSVNGTTVKKTGKYLRKAVTCNSHHHAFWREAIKLKIYR